LNHHLALLSKQAAYCSLFVYRNKALNPADKLNGMRLIDFHDLTTIIDKELSSGYMCLPRMAITQ